jgi:hypothetical protein
MIVTGLLTKVMALFAALLMVDFKDTGGCIGGAICAAAGPFRAVSFFDLELITVAGLFICSFWGLGSFTS